MRRWSRVSVILLGLLGGLGPGAVVQAQSLTVRVVEDSSKVPLPGALVRVLRRDSLVAQGLAADGGRVTLAIPGPGRYVVRVGRIGYVVRETWTVDLAADEARTLEVVLAGERVVLPAVVVTGERRCGRTGDEGSTAATLWDQIREALMATRLAQQSPTRFRIATVERELTANGAIVREERSRPRTGHGNPFGTLPPARLAREGFVQASGDNRVFFGPDADLLLSDEFVSGHCFRVMPPPADRPELVGLGFDPARKPRIADIKGVLWVDRQSAELRRLEFQYVGPADVVPRVGDARGWVRFDRAPDGPWYIGDWIIRMPRVARIEPRAGSASSARDSLLGYVEQGGGAEPADLPRAALATAPVQGTVFDSLAGHGLAGVVVRVAGVQDSTVTDAAGAFTLDAPLGSRVVSFRHPLLATMPDRTSRPATVTASGARVEIGTPSPATLAAQRCGPSDGASALVGRVRPGPTGRVDSVTVLAVYYSRAAIGVLNEERIATLSDGGGIWALCDLPSVSSLVVRQVDGRRVLAQAIARVAEGQATWTDLSSDLGRTGTVTLELRVLSGAGKPLVAAQVSAPDLGWAGLTDRDGRFLVPSAPVGAVRLSIRGSGRVALDTALVLPAQDTVRLALRVGAGTVVAAADGDAATEATSKRMAGFERRRREGAGRFLDRAALEAMGSQPLGPALRRLARIKIIDADAQAAIASSQRGTSDNGPAMDYPWPKACYLQVLVDGARVWAPGADLTPFNLNRYQTDDLVGIELYVGPTTPSELSGTGAVCGTIALWTR